MQRWDGTAVIMASGPSLTAEDCEAVHHWRADGAGRYAVAINTTFRRAPWANVIYGCDYAWWKTYIDEVRIHSRAELWTQDPLAAGAYGLRYMESQRGAGLAKHPNLIFQGGHGGHQAIALAAKWGASKIVLLGFDMQHSGGQSHWHGKHPSGLEKIPPFAHWIDQLETLACDLRKNGIEAVNATRQTALKCFTQKTLAEALS